MATFIEKNKHGTIHWLEFKHNTRHRHHPLDAGAEADLRRHQLVQLLFDITDPIIEPLRRIIPPVGAFDLSVMIAVFALFALAGALRAAV